MPQDKIVVYPSIAAFARSLGKMSIPEFDFTIFRLEELHAGTPPVSPPFRTEYHAFLLIDEGTGSYTIDGHTFALQRGSYYFTNPGHVKSYHLGPGIRGYIICFTDRALQSYYGGEIGFDFPFLYASTVPVLQLNEKQYARTEVICHLLLNTFNQPSAFRVSQLAHQLVSLLYLTKELLIERPQSLDPGNRQEELAASFRQLLNEHVLGERPHGKVWTVTEFAEQLLVHPNYLSQVVKEATGFTPKHLIEERIITEATSLLKNTQLTVAQVADVFGYLDASNFSRFFKRKVGISPRAYRQTDDNS